MEGREYDGMNGPSRFIVDRKIRIQIAFSVKSEWRVRQAYIEPSVYALSIPRRLLHLGKCEDIQRIQFHCNLNPEVIWEV
jgi:hypothetical protein